MNTQTSSSEHCPVCDGTGWEQYTENGYDFVRECKCGIRQKKIMNGRLSFANIPEAFADVRMDSFNTDAYEDEKSRSRAALAVKAIEYWYSNFDEMNQRGMGLYLYSEEKGSGKTRMAVSIANELIHDKHIQVKFATSLQILNAIKESWDGHGESEGKLLDYLSKSDVLIIDDFGTEQVKDWIGERFYQIINARYIDKRVTIYTSNVRLDDLKYDDRITNRIKERTFLVPFPEESVRNIIAKQNMSELVQGIRKGG